MTIDSKKKKNINKSFTKNIFINIIKVNNIKIFSNNSLYITYQFKTKQTINKKADNNRNIIEILSKLNKYIIFNTPTLFTIVLII